MVSIYCIQDINGLKYVGSTKQKLKRRLQKHRYDKTSSKKLDLKNCIIYELENCSKENKFEREKYWINKLDTVNIRKLNYDQKKYDAYKNSWGSYYNNNLLKIDINLFQC